MQYRLFFSFLIKYYFMYLFKIYFEMGNLKSSMLTAKNVKKKN